LLTDMKSSFQAALSAPLNKRGFALDDEAQGRRATVRFNNTDWEMSHGSVVIAAITSCTNTSNPSVMIAAGLLAKNAVQRGLKVQPFVKTSLAPGSRVVTDYLDDAGLTPYLNALGFHTVGYGCTTCIGNSGPLPEAVSAAISEHDLVAASVLSGNRNFEGRIHALVKASYLASPPLVVAYALAGNTNIDLTTEPLGSDKKGSPVYLRDIWPTSTEIADTVAASVGPELFRKQYADVLTGNSSWNAITGAEGDVFAWDSKSTYIQEPPFFVDLAPEPSPIGEITGARVLVMLGDSITTDHISPAGSIAADSPAGLHLQDHGVNPPDFNSYGSRRGNDRVMTRGTFANIRLRNLLAPGTDGGMTIHLPSGDQTTIFDAAMRYREEGTPLLVLAGKEYGTGSSRDWAAKGTLLLGVRAVIAQSYERIHRANLVGMGVLPLQFKDGDTRESLGLTGHEHYDIQGLNDELAPGQELTVRATNADGVSTSFSVKTRIDTAVEVEYYRNGGILQTVLRQLAKQR
ncbi:MAG: aconitate hydratase AcnA, partial [Planctomycetes bacterium]|nr:aconitate hydratase AcnA [Planctomycetota bacterium]